jgi:hypothetical protein
MIEPIRLVDAVGWLATAVFVSSYVLKDQTKLRRLQAIGAGLWIVYGLLLHALPVVAANVIVAAVALYSTRRAARLTGEVSR